MTRSVLLLLLSGAVCAGQSILAIHDLRVAAQIERSQIS